MCIRHCVKFWWLKRAWHVIFVLKELGIFLRSKHGNNITVYYDSESHGGALSSALAGAGDNVHQCAPLRKPPIVPQRHALETCKVGAVDWQPKWRGSLVILWGSAMCTLCIGFFSSFNAWCLIGKARLLDSWRAENHWHEWHLLSWATVVNDVKTLPEFLVFTLEGSYSVSCAKHFLSFWEKFWQWLLTYPSFTGIHTKKYCLWLGLEECMLQSWI